MGDDRTNLRKWCFTINNYTEEDEQNLLDELTPDKVVYAIVGREKGESGTPHLQGYVYFKRRLKMSTAKATLGKTAHLEPARGTPGKKRTVLQQRRRHPPQNRRGGGDSSVVRAPDS